MVFSPDGIRLASATDRGDFKVWDVETGQCCMAVEIEYGKRCVWFAFFAPHRLIVMATLAETFGSDRKQVSTQIRFWDIEWRGSRGMQDGPCKGILDGRFLPDGTKLAVGNGEDISVINVCSQASEGTYRVRHRCDAPPCDGLLTHRHRGCIGTPGQRACLAPRPTSLERVAIFRLTARSLVTFVAPSGRRLAVAHSASLQTGDIRTVKSFDRHVGSLTLSPDGDRLASAIASGLKIWDLSAGVSRTRDPGRRMLSSAGLLSLGIQYLPHRRRPVDCGARSCAPAIIAPQLSFPCLVGSVARSSLWVTHLGAMYLSAPFVHRYKKENT